MKRKMTLLTLDGLSEEAKKDYVAAKLEVDGKEVDGFALDVEGIESHPEAGALHRAKKREKERAQAAEDDLRKLKTELQTFKDNEHERLRGTRPKEEVDALEKSYQGKLKERDDRIALIQGGLNKHLVSNVARDIATAIAVDNDAVPALLPHILPRLIVEMAGDEPTTRVLDASGKPSAATVQELQKELLAAAPLARLVSGTKAKGSGAPGGNTNRGSAPPPKIDYSKSPKEVAAALKAADTDPDSEE